MLPKAWMSESSRTEPSGGRRGRLKVFLGYAAGVGKTYQMLEEAQRLRREGVDVVIGYFEPHGRKDTIEKTEGLESIPRKLLEYRGARFEEMDTDAILARRPAVAVVDEYAHTNVPGSERAKRWQDVELLLDGGIDVLTSMNVQHLESLNDQVWHVTGVRVRETIPDWVVQNADETVMVDVTPRALIHRLERGVVYAPAKAQSALENFFTETNLTALRELAMRQTAHQIEDRLEQPISDRVRSAWGQRAGDRILVQVTPNPDTAMLIRRGKRVADYLQSSCVAVFVARTDNWEGLTAEQKDSVERQLNFAKNMHIDVQVLTDRDAAGCIVEFARQHGIRQIYVSRSSPEARKIVEIATDMVVTVVAARKRPA